MSLRRGIIAGRISRTKLEVLTAYANIVMGIDDLISYWRLSNDQTVLDAVGGHDGTFDGTVSLVSGLAPGGDQATNFPGDVSASIPHDDELSPSEVSLSLWFELPSIGTEHLLFSKDAPGLNNGDYSLWVRTNGDLRSQFQSGSAQFPIDAHGTEAGRAYHVGVKATDAGHELWVDGKHVGTETGYTNALVGNIQDILFGTAQWSSDIMTGILDEVAIFGRGLTDAEFIALSRRTGTPIAGSTTTSVVESQSITVDVAALSQYVGRKADLNIDITNQGAFGTASIDLNNNLVYTADPDTADEVDTIDFTVTDENGTSAEATLTFNIQEADLGGGTLVYRWKPLAEWIDGVSLSNRSAGAIDQLSRWRDPNAATVGSNLPKSILNGGQAGYYLNRAPTGEPCIEIWAAPPGSPFYPGAGGNVANFAIQLWDHLGVGSGPWPRHVRVVMEVKTCKPADPTTFKGDGKGTLTGSYTDFAQSHDDVSIKYFAGTYAGNFVAGGGNANWWNDHTLPITRSGLRLISLRANNRFSNYLYAFGRPSKFGDNPSDSGFPEGMQINHTGIVGVWHRIEIEIQLTSPGTVPENAARNNPSIDPRPHSADGVARYYVTKDIDGELGTPGTRTLVDQVSNVLFFPKHDNVGSDDNMHTLAAIGGFWLNVIYGGSNSGAKAEAWAWVRQIEVYRHDS